MMIRSEKFPCMCVPNYLKKESCFNFILYIYFVCYLLLKIIIYPWFDFYVRFVFKKNPDFTLTGGFYMFFNPSG